MIIIHKQSAQVCKVGWPDTISPKNMYNNWKRT